MTQKKYFSFQNLLQEGVFISLLFALFFAIGIGDRPFASPDEGRYVEIPREMLSTGDFLTPHLNGLKYFEKPPLFYWMQAGMIKLFGIKEGSMRLITLLFGTLGCFITYILSALLFDRRVGRYSAFVLGTSLLYYTLTRLILLDLVFSVFLFAALASLLVGFQKEGAKRRPYALLTAFFLGLAVMTKGIVALAIFCSVFFLWCLFTNSWKKLLPLYMPSALLVFFLVTVPWHLMVSLKNPSFFDFYFIQEHVTRYLTSYHRRTQPFWFFFPVVLLGFFPWTLFLPKALGIAFSKKISKEERSSALFLLIWVLFIVGFFSLGQSKLITYMVPLFPPLAILMGLFLGRTLPQIKKMKFEILGSVFLGLIMVYILHHYRHLIPQDDLTALAPYLDKTIILLLVMTGLTAFCFFIGKGAFIAWGVGGVFFLLLLNEASTFTTRISAKTATLLIKEKMPQETEVIIYGTYFQDVPVYLDRLVTIAEFRGELAFGDDLEPQNERMIKESRMWEKWHSKKPVCILVYESKYEKLKQHPHFNPYILLEHPAVSALCNQKPL